MKRILPFLLTAILAGTAFAGPKDTKEPKRNFTISKETTYVLGPLDKDGRIDYVAALNERLGKGVTADTNANVLLWKALGPKPAGSKRMPAEFYKLMGMEEPPEKGEYFVNLWWFLTESLGIEDPELVDDIQEQLVPTWSQPWSARNYPYISDWLKANDKPLVVAIEAVKRTHYFLPLVPSKGDRGSSGLISASLSVLRFNSVALAFASRAMLRLNDGKHDEAWQDLLACHRLARHVARGGTLSEWLMGIALEGVAQRADLSLLACPELDSKRFQGYLRDFQALPPMPTLAALVDLGGRFCFLDSLMLVDLHGRDGLRLIADFVDGVPANVPLPEGRLDNVNWDPALRSANRCFDRLAAALREQDRDRREKALDQIGAELMVLKKGVTEPNDLGVALAAAGISREARGKVFGNVVLCLMAPAFIKVNPAADRTEQRQRNLGLGFALAAYQRDHKSYPKTLEALSPKYLAKVPGDLYTGKPLTYRPSENGYLLYSHGPNGKDDDGREANDDPKGDDLTIRMSLARPKAK